MKRLQILGPGCSKCKMLAEHTEQAARAVAGTHIASTQMASARLSPEARYEHLRQARRR